MKTLLILLLAVSIGLAACSPAIPANNVPPAQPSEQQTFPAADVEDQFTTICDEVADPQAVVNALPSSFEELSVVGEIIAESGEMPPVDGQVQMYMNALKTLTYNDEYYISISATDSCGFNLQKAGFKQMIPGITEFGSVRPTTIAGFPAYIAEDDRGAHTIDVLIKDRLRVRIDSDPEVGEDRALEVAALIDFAAIEQAIP